MAGRFSAETSVLRGSSAVALRGCSGCFDAVEVGVDPLRDCVKHRDECCQELRGLVLDSWRDLVVLGSCDEAVAFEVAQLAGERGRGDGAESLDEFVETCFAVVFEAVQDRQLPATTDQVGERRNRAWLNLRCDVSHLIHFLASAPLVDITIASVPWVA
jgi:hypothetical protein